MDTFARDRGGRLTFRGALVTALFALAACTSGDGGGTPGGSQGPDPVVLDFAIAYVKRPVPEMDMQSDARQLLDPRAPLRLTVAPGGTIVGIP